MEEDHATTNRDELTNRLCATLTDEIGADFAAGYLTLVVFHDDAQQELMIGDNGLLPVYSKADERLAPVHGTQEWDDVDDVIVSWAEPVVGLAFDWGPDRKWALVLVGGVGILLVAGFMEVTYNSVFITWLLDLWTPQPQIVGGWSVVGAVVMVALAGGLTHAFDTVIEP